jgi:DNA polymerase-3 subunit delta
LLLTGSHLEAVDLELQKLAAYTGSDAVIHREAVDAVVTPLLEHTVFQLVDAVSLQDQANALRMLDVLLQHGQPILRIVSLLARQIKVMLLCKDYTAQGLTYQRIAEILTVPPLKIHPYALKKSMDYQRGFTREQLRGGLQACLQLDFFIKRGRTKERLGMELLLIQLCSTNPAIQR